MKVVTAAGYEIEFDDADEGLVSAFAWSARKDGNNVYARTKRTINGRRFTIVMHRLIMSALPGEIVDHIDGNGLNNRRSNLRICTSQQNNINRHKFKHGFRGIRPYRLKDGRVKWQAGIDLYNKSRGHSNRVNIGSFWSATFAAKAWDEVAREWYGAYAKLNFPS